LTDGDIHQKMDTLGGGGSDAVKTTDVYVTRVNVNVRH